jgi:hypothetical protein
MLCTAIDQFDMDVPEMQWHARDRAEIREHEPHGPRAREGDKTSCGATLVPKVQSRGTVESLKP